MSKQHYFVIYFDTATKQWAHDPELEELKFQNKTIWCHETEDWQHGYLGDGIFNDNNDYTTDMLSAYLSKLNQQKENNQ
jgi:hypothetical protein